LTRTLAALAILLVLATGNSNWKLTLTREWTVFESPDMAIQVRPWLDYQAREFHAGRIPLWDPYEWAGHTLIGQVQPVSRTRFNWILFVMPLTDGHIPILTLHWYWVLIHWLAAVFFYALCRDLGATFIASILGACIYTLTGFMGPLGWPQILMPCVWIPVILLFFLARRKRPPSAFQRRAVRRRNGSGVSRRPSRSPHLHPGSLVFDVGRADGANSGARALVRAFSSGHPPRIRGTNPPRDRIRQAGHSMGGCGIFADASTCRQRRNSATA